MARRYNGDIIQVPSHLESIYGKYGKAANEEISKAVKCKNFVFEVPERFKLIKRNCDFMIYVSDAKATKLIIEK